MTRNRAVKAYPALYDIRHIHAEDVAVGMRLRYDGVVETVTSVQRLTHGRLSIITNAGIFAPCNPGYLFLQVFNERD